MASKNQQSHQKGAAPLAVRYGESLQLGEREGPSPLAGKSLQLGGARGALAPRRKEPSARGARGAFTLRSKDPSACVTEPALPASRFDDRTRTPGTGGRLARTNASPSRASAARRTRSPARTNPREISVQSGRSWAKWGIINRLPCSETSAAWLRTWSQPASVVGAKSSTPASVMTWPAESQITSAAGSSSHAMNSEIPVDCS